MAFIKITWNDKSVTSSCLSNYFYFALWSFTKWRSSPTYEKQSYLSIFGCNGPFPQDFRQLHAQIIRYFIKIKRVCFIITCPIVFLGSKYVGRSVKTIKNEQFKVFLDVWILSPKFFGRLRSRLYYNFVKWYECHM